MHIHTSNLGQHFYHQNGQNIINGVGPNQISNGFFHTGRLLTKVSLHVMSSVEDYQLVFWCLEWVFSVFVHPAAELWNATVLSLRMPCGGLRFAEKWAAGGSQALQTKLCTIARYFPESVLPVSVAILEIGGLPVTLSAVCMLVQLQTCPDLVSGVQSVVVGCSFQMFIWWLF